MGIFTEESVALNKSVLRNLLSMGTRGVIIHKYKEISDELNIPVGTVKGRIFQARKKLMQKLEA